MSGEKNANFAVFLITQLIVCVFLVNTRENMGVFLDFSLLFHQRH